MRYEDMTYLDKYVPGLSSDPTHHREFRWTGKIRQIKLQKTASGIAVEPLNVYQSTDNYILLASLIFPKCSRG